MKTAILSFALALMAALGTYAVLADTGSRYEFENSLVSSGSYWVNDREMDSNKNLDLTTAGTVEQVVTTEAGTYDIEFRYKTGDWANPTVALNRYNFYLDGQLLQLNSTYRIVNEPTSQWIAWGSRAAQNITIPSGQHTIKVVTNQAWGTLDYFELVRKDATPKPSKYVVFQESSVFKTLNADTGVVEFQGSSANSAMQYAMNKMIGTGGSLLIKPGTYRILNTVNLVSDVTVEFEGSAKLLANSSGSILMSGNGISNVKIINPNIESRQSGVKGLAFFNSKNIEISGGNILMTKGGSSSGIFCNNCINAYVHGTTVQRSSYGISMIADSFGLSRNITVENTKVNDISILGIRVNKAVSVKVISNTVTNTNDNAIDIGSNLYSEVRGNTIKNAGIPISHGIDTDNTTSALIIDNTIDTTGSSGVSIFRSRNVTVINTNVTNSGANGMAIIIPSEPSTNITIMSSVISNAGDQGIWMSSAQNNVLISNNTFDSPSANGIFANTGQNNLTIMNNIFRNIPDSQQAIRTSTGTVYISGNIIES